MRLTRTLLKYEFKFFKRYVDACMNEGVSRTLYSEIIGGWKTNNEKTSWHYDENRPWTDGFRDNNRPGQAKKTIPVQQIKDWTVYKGDMVQILVGKDKGKHGIVNSIIKERNWVYVEGLNCEYKIVEYVKGLSPTCIKSELPLLVTNQVKLVDPSDDKPTEVEWRFTEEGKKVRVSTRTGRIIPMPTEASITDDFVLPSTYQPTDKDTKEKELIEVTFEPKLMTFEEEMMKEFGIKEERKPAQTYWY